MSGALCVADEAVTPGRSVAVLKNTLLVGADGVLFEALRAWSGAPAVFAFDRGARESNGASRWQAGEVPGAVIVDGASPPRSIVGRLRPLLRMAGALRAAGMARRPLEVAVAGSSELAILLHLLGVQARRKYYLLADLTWFHRTPGVRTLVAGAERRCIEAGWTPVLTSPDFHRTYFGALGLPIERCLFVHNAEVHLDWTVAVRRPAQEPPRTVLWSGLLRCRRSLEMLVALAQAQDHRWTVRLAGRLVSPEMEGIAAAAPRLLQRGPYRPQETPSVIAEGDLLWGCDWSLGENSMALLPNRLFHAVLGCRPIVVSQGTFLEKVVLGYDIGLSVPPDAQAIAASLAGITPQRHRRWIDNLQALSEKLRAAPAGWTPILEGRAAPMTRAMADGRVFG